MNSYQAAENNDARLELVDYTKLDTEKRAVPAGYARGAGGGGRTRTVSLPPDFESGTSANSIIPAYC